MHHYPFHPSDYLSHTRHLSLMEDLAYRRMLDLYYLHERPLVGDVARLIGMSEHGKDVVKVLAEFFPKGKNRRADREIAKYSAMRDAASRAGKASANARSTTVQRRLSTTVQPTKNQNQEREPQPVQNQSRAAAAAVAGFDRPDDASEQVWLDWLKHRKKCGGTVTVTVIDRLRKDAIAAGMTLDEAMAHSAAQGYRGFFPPKVGANGKDHRPRAAMANLPRVDDAAAIKAFYPQPKEGEFM